jgi:hypothetical protein
VLLVYCLSLDLALYFGLSSYILFDLVLCLKLIFQDFKDGKVDTAFIPKHEDELQAVSELSITSWFASSF